MHTRRPAASRGRLQCVRITSSCVRPKRYDRNSKAQPVLFGGRKQIIYYDGKKNNNIITQKITLSHTHERTQHTYYYNNTRQVFFFLPRADNVKLFILLSHYMHVHEKKNNTINSV